MMKRILPFTILGLLTAGVAQADDLSVHESATSDEPRVAITVSPLHIFVPMAELTAEVRADDKLGIAVIGGVGRYHEIDTNARISLIEAGVSARYYALGSFRTGLQLGTEVLYVHAYTDAMNVEVKAAGLGVSPFAGYKWTHSSGFTLEGELGVSYMVARAHAETGQMAKESKIGALVNFQLGYSF